MDCETQSSHFACPLDSTHITVYRHGQSVVFIPAQASSWTWKQCQCAADSDVVSWVNEHFNLNLKLTVYHMDLCRGQSWFEPINPEFFSMPDVFLQHHGSQASAFFVIYFFNRWNQHSSSLTRFQRRKMSQHLLIERLCDEWKTSELVM